MNLYGHLVSPYVARVVLAAELKGISLEPQPIPGGNLKSAEFLALNPMGKMPALKVGDDCIAESMVIMDYLEEAYPAPSLLPQDPLLRAQARLLGRIVDLYVMASTRPLFAGLDPTKRDEAEVAAGKDAYFKALSQLEHFMGSGPFAVGSTLGYADCAMLPCLQLMSIIASRYDIADPYADLPKLSAWWRHMQTTEPTQAFIERYQTAVFGFFQSRR
jgi:glutathione S-transferase